MRGALSSTVAVAAIVLAAGAVRAQDSNINIPIRDIEQRFLYEPFQIIAHQGTRFEGDRTQRAILLYPDSFRIAVKWAAAPRGGETFNNVPRYEVAAYKLQELFLDPADYVVPPTLPRVVSTAWYRSAVDGAAPSTFDEANSVLIVLQYWLWNVTSHDVYDKDRFERDTVYARHLGDMNILTYLIRHGDQNLGNFLISTDSANPRVFAVDNGVSFDSELSDRGHAWRSLRVKRLPAGTVARLRAITRARLDSTLGVLAQFQVQGDTLAPVPPGPNLNPKRPIRRENGVIQLGLDRHEIDGVANRIRDLLKKVDKGDIAVF